MTSALPSSSVRLRSLRPDGGRAHRAAQEPRFESLNAVVEDADIDALDEEITRPSPLRPKRRDSRSGFA